MCGERRENDWTPLLPKARIEANFEQIRPPLTDEEAVLEAQRCFYCPFDTPCTRGCPTNIDIPTFIRQIAEGEPKQAARTILQANIFGAVCARVCPVEKLCEQLCICQTVHGKADRHRQAAALCHGQADGIGGASVSGGAHQPGGASPSSVLDRRVSLPLSSSPVSVMARWYSRRRTSRADSTATASPNTRSTETSFALSLATC